MPLKRIRPYRQAASHPAVLPVAVISLEDQCGRRAQAEAGGIPKEWIANFWSAADFRGAERAAIAGQVDLPSVEDHLGRQILAGEAGCALSHQMAARWLAGSRHDLMLVLEDDAIPLEDDFEDSVLSVANTLNNHARSGAAFVCLLTLDLRSVRRACKRRVRVPKGQQSAHGPVVMLHSDPDTRVWRAHAYLVSRSAAERSSLRESRILTLADDWHERRELALIDQIFYTLPVIFGLQEQNVSSIEAEGLRQQPSAQGELRRRSERKGRRSGPMYLASRVHRRLRRLLALLISPLPVRLREIDQPRGAVVVESFGEKT